MSSVVTLSQDDFQQAISGPKPLLVDFWAEWCAPCRAIVPLLEQIAAQEPDRLVIAKVNVDESPDIAYRLGIMSLPTLVLFAGGEERLRIVGLRNKEQLLRELEPHLPSVKSA